MKIKAVCVYCGSNPGRKPEYARVASAFGAQLAQEGITLIYGGGNVGLMGAVADGAIAAGGRVIGVMPNALVAMEIAHRGITELKTVDTMHERKKLMAELADAFVALPGGLGTIEELFEMVTWGLLGFHEKPCVVLNVAGYYGRLLQFMDHMVGEGFITRDHLARLEVATDHQAVIAKLRSLV